MGAYDCPDELPIPLSGPACVRVGVWSPEGTWHYWGGWDFQWRGCCGCDWGWGWGVSCCLTNPGFDIMANSWTMIVMVVVAYQKHVRWRVCRGESLGHARRLCGGGTGWAILLRFASASAIYMKHKHMELIQVTN